MSSCEYADSHNESFAQETNSDIDKQESSPAALGTSRVRFTSYLKTFVTLIAFLFLIVVEIGSTKTGSFYSSLYFLRMDISGFDPFPPDIVYGRPSLRDFGLAEYYQFGLWNFYEGDHDHGTTYCSKPKTSYFFNPVAIILSELHWGLDSKHDSVC